MYTKCALLLIVWSISIVINCTQTKGQFITINDPLLKYALNDRERPLMSTDSSSLDTIAAATKTGTLQLQYYGFTTVTELKYFKNINFFQTVDNNISTLPNFTGFTNLKFIDLRGNPWSDFTQLDPIKNQLNMILLRRIPSGNEIKDFSFLTSSFPNLKSIQFTNFNAEILPDFSLFSGLTQIKINNNKLTFTDLIPLTTLPSYATILDVMPQNILTNDTSIQIFRNTSFTLTTPIDNGLSGIYYELYKGTTLIDSSTSNSFTFTNVTTSDSGIYHIKIKSTHPFFAGNYLQTGKYTLTTAACPTLSSVDVEVSEACDLVPVKFTSINSTSSYQADTISLKDKIRNKIFYFSLQNSKEIPVGSYDLYIKNTNGCAYNYPNFKNISLAKKCNDIFSPNGDGITDDFFIELIGSATIRNKQGIIVRELAVPAYWDGNDQNGNPVEIGIYAITFSDHKNEVRKVTVLR